MLAASLVIAALVVWGVGPSRAFGAILALLVGSLLRVRRAHVEAAMRRSGVAHPGRTAGAMYRALGRGLFELLYLGLAGERGLRRVRVPDQALADLRRNGRGCVVATAHTGNWDLVACAVAARVPLTVVTKHFKVGVLDALWQGVRATSGLRLVAAGAAQAAVSRALARGEVVAMVVDQAPERARGTMEAPFLGATARVDLAPALAALRARVPLVAAFPVRLADGTHGITIAGVFDPPERPARAWAVETTWAVTALLDAHVRAHPEQWLWMHRRWKGVPERPEPFSAALAGAGG